MGDLSMIAEAELGSVGVGVSKEKAMGRTRDRFQTRRVCACWGRRAREAAGGGGEVTFGRGVVVEK